MDETEEQRRKRICDEFYEWLVALLQERDPVALIYEETPPREYEPEARAIVPLMERFKTQTELEREIYRVFVHYFTHHVAGSRKDYADIARAALAKWNELNGTPQA
jgi:hypothetical protein